MKKIYIPQGGGRDFWLRIPMNNESAGRHLCMDDVDENDMHVWLESGYGGCWTLVWEKDGAQRDGIAAKVPASFLGYGTYSVVMAGKFVNGDSFRTKRQLFIRLVDREDQADAEPTMYNEEQAYWAGPAVLSEMLSRDGLNTYELWILQGNEGSLEDYLSVSGLTLNDFMVQWNHLSVDVQSKIDRAEQTAINPKGDYDEEVEYHANDLVYDSETLSSYVSLLSHNTGNPVTDTTYWMKVLDGDDINQIKQDAEDEIDDALQDARTATTNAVSATTAAEAVVAQKVADAQIGYYECNTAAGTATKATTTNTIGQSTFAVPVKGCIVKVKMTNANTATGTVYLQFGSDANTKKELKYNGLAVDASNTWEDGETISVFYDGTYYQASNAQGGGGKAEKIKYDNSQSGLAAENVQGALDDISEICLEKQDLNLTGNYVGKYALNKTTGALVSNSSYRLYEFNLSQYTDEGSLFITGGKGNSDVGVIGQYDSDDNLVGTVYAAATNNKEFEILDGAVTLKLSVYPDSYTVRLVYGIAITQKIDALTSEVDVLSDEIDNLNDVTEDIPAKQAWDAAMKLGTRLSDSSGYNSKYAFAFKKEISETMVIESIEHPSVSELSVDVIIVDSNTLKIVDKKRVVLDGTKTELLNDVVVIPKGCYIGFAAPEGAVSALTEFKYKKSDYDKTSPSGYVFDSSAIGSIGSTSSYNTCTYVINMREYNSIISQIQNLATSHIEEYTENDCVIAKSAINAKTGIVTDNGWSSTQFISIKGYKTILFSVDYTSNNYGIAFYDSNKNILTNKGIAFHSETNTYYTIPDNAEYIRFCAKDDGTIHISITLEATGLGGFMREYSDLQDNVEELNEKTSSIKTKLRILAVGNSYTRDSMEYVAQILSNMGVNNVTMYYLYHSGASLSHWLEQYDSGVDNIIAYHACGEQDIVREASLATLFESDWDIVSFQQYSVDSVDYSTYTALARLIAAVKEHCTNPDVKIAWHMTWSRWSGESTNPHGLTGYNNIVSTVRQMLNDYGTVIDYIIPTGTAMQNARNTSLNTTHELAADNGGHASAGVGYYIIALTWIQSLVCPFAGKRLIDDDVFTIDVSSVSQNYETENVTDENRLLCQRVALAACSNPFNVTTLE